MRKLATVQVIKDLQHIPGADKIEVATVLGRKCVVKKGDFKVWWKCIYIEIDSFVPENSTFEFLWTPREFDWKVWYRIKTIKLKWQVSQWLVLPLTNVSTIEEWAD